MVIVRETVVSLVSDLACGTQRECTLPHLKIISKNQLLRIYSMTLIIQRDTCAICCAATLVVNPTQEEVLQDSDIIPN
jgi:hypothetical protein